MFLWNTAKPYRDGDLEAGIVIHELSHGMSTRLTGGPADSTCLGWGESGGMGEGWGGESLRGPLCYYKCLIPWWYRFLCHDDQEQQGLLRLCHGCVGSQQGEGHPKPYLLTRMYRPNSAPESDTHLILRCLFTEHVHQPVHL